MNLFDTLKLSCPIMLAPMAGVSVMPFRMLNRKFGCECTFTEMISARSLSYRNKKTREMLITHPMDRPFGIQLLGREPQYILKALENLVNYEFDILDFNAACPTKKVTNKGRGAALLKEPKELNRLLKLLVQRSTVPVTVKLRLGWDSAADARDIALYAEDAGINGIFLHGRTKQQGYSGKVDYESIKNVKKAVRIPLIASGDIISPFLAKKMFDETGCDGILVARGCLGNPWIFNEIKTFLKTGTIPPPPEIDDILTVMKEHLNAYCDLFGDERGIKQFRKFYIWYTCGFTKVRPLRCKVGKAKTREALSLLIDDLRTVDDRKRVVKSEYVHSS